MGTVALIMVILLIVGFVLLHVRSRVLFDVVVFLILLFLLVGQLGVLGPMTG